MKTKLRKLLRYYIQVTVNKYDSDITKLVEKIDKMYSKHNAKLEHYLRVTKKLDKYLKDEKGKCLLILAEIISFLLLFTIIGVLILSKF